MVNTLQGLFTFALSVAGLAFVAGAILIANSAGLTVIERRHEIGVFKAVGYTSGHVLRLLVAEYGFLGMFSGILGLVGVYVVITVINLSQGGSVQMVMNPVITLLMLLASVSIAVLSAMVIAWQPTHVRPLDVLRYE